MDLSPPTADEIVRPRRRRTRRFALVLGILAALAGGTAHAALADGVQLSINPNPATPGANVTMTANVSSSLDEPDGTVTFVALSGPVTGVLDSPLGEATTDVDANNTTASFSTASLAAGTYTIQAQYSPTSFPQNIIYGIVNMPSNVVTLVVSSNAPPPKATTQIVLNAPATITTSSIALTATVSRTSAPAGTPTGTVEFTDMISGSGAPLGSAPLVGGVATLTVMNLAPGPHLIMAAYDGDASDQTSTSAEIPVQYNAPVPNVYKTTATVTTTPSTIAQGDLVTILATINQTVISGNSVPPPPGGEVTFSSSSECPNLGGSLGQAVLGTGPAGVTVAANQAAIETSTLQPCAYTITADYSGDQAGDEPGTGTGSLTVLPPRASTTITNTGATSVEYGHSATFAATVTDQNGTGLSGRAVTFTLGSQHCTATSDANGNASCSVTVTQDVPGATLAVSVPQDLQTSGATLTLNFTVSQQPTTLSAGYQLGQTLTTLTGTLLGDAGPVASQLVTLTLGGESCSATTSSAGVATCTVATLTGQQTATLGALFGGTTDYAASSASSTAQLVFNTSLQYTGATTVAYQGAAALSAVLSESNGTLLANRTVTFALGSQSCTGTTNASGVASCTIASVTQAAGPYTVTTSYAGDFMTNPVTVTTPFTVTPVLTAPTTLTYTGLKSAEYHDLTLLSGTLLGPNKTPLVLQRVTFTLGSQSCTGITDLQGVAVCLILVLQPSGTYPLTASFAGNSTYAPSTVSGTFTVLHEDTTVADTTASTALAGSSTTLSGVLLEDGFLPVAGRTLTLKLGTQMCTGVTSAAGVATCNVTASGTLGPVTASASFAGDAYYLGASASTQSLLYALAPGGGSFVIGDRDATGAVTFWGSQWSKSNAMSGGAAPSSFKGFALQPTAPACGVNWSTDPGNSAPPPSGPLPTYMAVIVTSSTTKSGSAISGNTIAVVVVKTNGGYDGNPGHAGTGTVVATVCGSVNGTINSGNGSSGGSSGCGGH